MILVKQLVYWLAYSLCSKEVAGSSLGRYMPVMLIINFHYDLIKTKRQMDVHFILCFYFYLKIIIIK